MKCRGKNITEQYAGWSVGSYFGFPLTTAGMTKKENIIPRRRYNNNFRFTGGLILCPLITDKLQE
jgi:hypothetical protein